MTEFDYFTAFKRNLGFLDRAEQTRLREARVAVAGLGGTGGAQVHALARLGIGAFNLADLDTYELANFNRQMGATMQTIGRNKVEVAREIAQGINPEANVLEFGDGINAANIDAFLENVDVVVDSLDFYCFEQRFLLYGEARKRGIWVLTAPPLGFGFTLLAFNPAGMRFEDYFGFTPDMGPRDLAISLIAGIAPRPWMLKYLHQGGLDVGQQQLPSVGAAPFMIAGMIATEVANLLTGKTGQIQVPTIIQYDAMLRRYRQHTYPMGMRSPVQRLKKWILGKKLPR